MLHVLMQRGSSWSGLLTHVLTGRRTSSSADARSGGTGCPSSQPANAEGGRMTGMRWCTDATAEEAAVVRMMQVSTESPAAIPVQDRGGTAFSGTRRTILFSDSRGQRGRERA